MAVTRPRRKRSRGLLGIPTLATQHSCALARSIHYVVRRVCYMDQRYITYLSIQILYLRFVYFFYLVPTPS